MVFNFLIIVGRQNAPRSGNTKHSDPVRIIVISNECHRKGMLEIDNLNSERYFNVRIMCIKTNTLKQYYWISMTFYINCISFDFRALT